MKVLPLLMSGSMVRACLREIEAAGTGKTETRRIASRRNTVLEHGGGAAWPNWVSPDRFRFEEATQTDEGHYTLPWDNLGGERIDIMRPRISAGDLLYVREHWRAGHPLDSFAPRNLREGSAIEYIADEAEAAEPRGKHRQGMHMPKWASRITLEVEATWLEPINRIDDLGSIREGVTECADFSQPHCPEYWVPGETNIYPIPTMAFQELWNNLNEKRGFGFATNPIVTVIRFKPKLINILDLQPNSDGASA